MKDVNMFPCFIRIYSCGNEAAKALLNPTRCHEYRSSSRESCPSMSFGFSVGDFISALHLMGTVISSIRDSSGSSAEYRVLMYEFYALERALLQVKQLEFRRGATIRLCPSASASGTMPDRYRRILLNNQEVPRSISDQEARTRR